MKQIGKRVFECKDGELKFNTHSDYHDGIENLEEWLEELLNWE